MTTTIFKKYLLLFSLFFVSSFTIVAQDDAILPATLDNIVPDSTEFIPKCNISIDAGLAVPIGNFSTRAQSPYEVGGYGMHEEYGGFNNEGGFASTGYAFDISAFLPLKTLK